MRKTFMLVVSLLAVVVPFAASGKTISGTWAANRLKEGDLQLNLNFAEHNNLGTHFALAALPPLSSATIGSSAATAAKFALVREAGAVQFEGTFRDGRGSGVFDFTPNRDFPAKLSALGVKMNGETIDDHDLFLFTVIEVSTQRIRELQALGYRDLDLEDVKNIAIHGITPDFIREMRSLNLGALSLEDLLALRIHGVTVNFVREMVAMGFPRPDKENVVSWRIHGVTPSFVKELRELGYRDVSSDDLLAARIHGVTPALIRELRSLGYENLSMDELVAMRIHGVTPQYIRELRDAGYERIPAEKLVDMRIRGIDARRIRARQR